LNRRVKGGEGPGRDGRTVVREAIVNRRCSAVEVNGAAILATAMLKLTSDRRKITITINGAAIIEFPLTLTGGCLKV
jgi:hypothetical protein